jgi:hypothetical protein
VTTLIADRPVFTTLLEDASDFFLADDAIYISAVSAEMRSRHVEDLRSRCPDSGFVDVEERSDGKLRWSDGSSSGEAHLRSQSELASFWHTFPARGNVYLDITGLTHSLWAPLVASALHAGAPLRVVYVEPKKYRRSSLSQGSELFDLSTGFGGLAPLPGFASLAEADEDDFYFVPLLGFEGRRFSYLMSEVAPVGDHVIPVIGVPGFQPEFVGFAYDGNRIPLLDNDAWLRVQFAIANCPFSAFYGLEHIASQHPGHFLKVAPIGTKPHGLGAVLFALANPSTVELIYDHPLRSPKRTEGAARLLVYDVYGLAVLRGMGAFRR